MEIAITVLLLIVGLVLIIKGGDFFVDAAAWMAEASGIPKFIIGCTVENQRMPRSASASCHRH